MARASYEGGCHCGRVQFRVNADLDRASICNCSICAMKGFIHVVVPPEDFELIQGGDAQTTYQFNTGTAQHWFCSTCGIHSHYVPRSAPGKIDVNARCLKGVDPIVLRPSLFDGQNWEVTMKQRAAED
ncbi:MAG: GFA family protein [Polyangiaceae bacterium]